MKSKYLSIGLVIVIALVLLFTLPLFKALPAGANIVPLSDTPVAETVYAHHYPGPYILDCPNTIIYISDYVWDLTQGDLILVYTINMTGILQPHGLPENLTEWEAYVGPTAKDPANFPNEYSTWVEVGLCGEGSYPPNPGPEGVYQGKCGGWMTSQAGEWVGYWDDGVFLNDGTEIEDLDDKHNLQASGGRDELDYDVLGDDWNTVLSPTIGNYANFGIWFDRDGVDQWQDDYWGNLGPGGTGSGDGLRYNTGGIYDISIKYHAIDVNGNGDKGDDGFGVMFATVNGYPQGFYTQWSSTDPPQYYPAGLSFKGDMKHMTIFTAIQAAWAPAGWDYGQVILTDVGVLGSTGVSDPLVADFTYSPDTIYAGQPVQFADASHGGMPPYSYYWDFNDDCEKDSGAQNPIWVFPTPGDHEVTLIIDPFRCEPQPIFKTLTVLPLPPTPPETTYDGEAVGIEVFVIDKAALLAPWIVLAAAVIAGSIFLVLRKIRR